MNIGITKSECITYIMTTWEDSNPSCVHRVVIPGNLYFGSKVWMTTKFFLTHFYVTTTDVTSDITSSVISHHTIYGPVDFG